MGQGWIIELKVPGTDVSRRFAVAVADQGEATRLVARRLEISVPNMAEVAGPISISLGDYGLRSGEMKELPIA